MKKALSLILIFALSISLVACTSENADLYSAFNKMQDIKTVETKMDMNFELQAEGLGEMEAMIFNMVAEVVNGMEFSMEGKSVGNEDNTAAKAEVEMDMKVMGMEIPLKVWLDVDLETSEMEYVIDMPSKEVLDMMGLNSSPEIAKLFVGKKYITYDLLEMMKMMEVQADTEVEEVEEIDFEEIIAFQEEFQPKMIEFMEKIQDGFEFDLEIVKLKETKKVDGKQTKIYELNLNDESFKKVTRKMVNYILQEEEARAFAVEFLDGYFKLMQKTGSMQGISQQELKGMQEFIANMNENIDELAEEINKEFNSFMDKIKDVQIIGDDGIKITYTVSDGYIVEEDGEMNFTIDLDQIAKLMEEDTENEMDSLGMKGKINFKIGFNSKNKNINNQDIKVIMPKTTKANSVDINRIMEVQMQELEKQMEMFEEVEVELEELEEVEALEALEELEEELEEIEEIE